MRALKILAVIVVLAVSLSAFASCDNANVKNLEAEAALKLLEAPYLLTVRMSMDYAFENGEFEVGDGSATGTSVKLNVDGTRFTMSTGSDSLSVKYTFVDNVLYIDMMGVKLRSEVSAEDVEDMLGTGASGIGKMTSDAFSSVKVEESDGVTIIKCKGLSDESNELIESLIGDIAELGEGDDAVTVENDELEYIAYIDSDGRYTHMKITVVMTTDVEGERMTMRSNIDISFDYENAVRVSAPEDADEYYDVGDIGDYFE